MLQTQEFCLKNRLFSTWIWQYADISKELDWNTSESKSESSDFISDDNSICVADSFSKNDDIDMIDNDTNIINEKVESCFVTENDRLIVAKRKIFNVFQFLIEKKSELHMWLSDRSCDNSIANKISMIKFKKKRFY
jgi:hypothetical protein